MGSFEKLGILVIVVIIVMILTVAIYQWGGTGSEWTAVADAAALAEEPAAPYVIVRDTETLAPPAAPAPADVASPASDPAGTPATELYEIQHGDVLSKLVVERWGLRYAFIQRIMDANPGIDMKALKAGQKLTIPAKEGFEAKPRRKSGPPGAGFRVYSVQDGDKLESIARSHLGNSGRWKEILKLNPGVDPKRLRQEQQLRIPLK
ncbi:MAG: LysM peptidoglycan-binding domain-containing protein [Planctomycetota bacterium]